MARTHFHNVLEKRVLEAVQSKSEGLAAGVAKSYDHYRYEAGFIQGLHEALKIADEISKEDQ